jgi:hypothetical protein
MSRASRAAQRRQEARLHARLKVEVWYPMARDLALPYVPDSERPRIRKRLSPWLANLKHGIKGGWCWKLAQTLALTAQKDDVNYVEGVWSRPYQQEDGEQPAPHAWVTVEGCRVDLVGEFFNWRCGDSEWDYEPLKEYSRAELTNLAPDYITIELSPEVESTTGVGHREPAISRVCSAAKFVVEGAGEEYNAPEIEPNRKSRLEQKAQVPAVCIVEKEEGRSCFA